MIHEYAMSRIHKTIFSGQSQSSTDELVHKLVLEKVNDPLWVLSCDESEEF